jgi:hypothetical protein
MTLVEIQKNIHGLTRSEKFFLVQQILAELAQEDNNSYKLDSKIQHGCWSQHNAVEAAAQLQEFLKQQT